MNWWEVAILRSSITWVLCLLAILLLACAPGPMRAQPQADVALMLWDGMASVLDLRPQGL
jgi:hypothetical protein